MEINLSFALLLTALAGLSTGIGSAIAFFIKTPKYSYLSVLLGFSAGVMIYISFAELLKTGRTVQETIEEAEKEVVSHPGS